MRALLISILIGSASICLASESQTATQSYLNLLQKYPKTLGPMGKSSEGDIEILLDPIKMQALEKSTGRKVGIVAQDKYWIWINDAVRFPCGAEGVYGRIVWQSSLICTSRRGRNAHPSQWQNRA